MTDLTEITGMETPHAQALLESGGFHVALKKACPPRGDTLSEDDPDVKSIAVRLSTCGREAELTYMLFKTEVCREMA